MINRILMTTDTLGGVWNYSVTLAKALKDYDIEVALATMGAPLSREQRQSVMALENVHLYESHYRLEWMEDPWDDVYAAGVWLQHIAARFQPDLVHLNQYAFGGLFDEPTLIVAHSDVLSWWEAVKGESAPVSWNCYREIVTSGLSDADYLIAPTSAMLRAIQRNYLPRCMGKVIPNGVSYQTEPPAHKDPIVLAVGRLWDEAKNIQALCAVAPSLNTEIYVAGADQHPDGHRATIDGVHPLGFLPPDTLRSWYQRAGVYAFPAYYEPFGLSVLEAAMHGCALVLSNIPSLQENWKDAALFVSPHDTAALQDAIQRLIDEPALRQHYGRLARRHAQQFTVQRQVKQYVQVYEKMGGLSHAY